MGKKKHFLSLADFTSSELLDIFLAAENMKEELKKTDSNEPVKHKTVEKLADYSMVPLVNGLTDLEHPCQALVYARFTGIQGEGSDRGGN